MTEYFRTGVPATEPEEITMRTPMPFMVMGGSVPPSPEQVIHEYALAHGLPEIRGYYGYDFEKHEFIRLKESSEGEPDQFPSRRLRDILSPLSDTAKSIDELTRGRGIVVKGYRPPTTEELDDYERKAVATVFMDPEKAPAQFILRLILRVRQLEEEIGLTRKVASQLAEPRSSFHGGRFDWRGEGAPEPDDPTG